MTTEPAWVSEIERFVEKNMRCKSRDARRLIADNRRMREALEPFAKYGKVLLGQRTSDDNVLIELWGNQITSGDLRRSALTQDDGR